MLVLYNCAGNTVCYLRVNNKGNTNVTMNPKKNLIFSKSFRKS